MYSKPKRFLSVALLAVLCMIVISGFTASGRESANPPPLETVMTIDVKTSTPLTEKTETNNLIKDDSIACYYEDGGSGYYNGPADYSIMDSDRFCVIDSENDCLRVYSLEEAALINSIDISYCERPLSVCYGDGIFYVYDPDWHRVVSYSEDGTMLADISVPGAGDESDYSSADEYCSKDIAIFCANLTNHNGEIMLVLGKNAKYSFNDYKLVNNSFVECEPLYTIYTDMSERESIYPGCDVEKWSEMTTVTYEDHTWTFDSAGVAMDILGVDEANNLYLFCSVDFISVEGKILCGSGIRVYDANSNLVRGADLDLSVFPVTPIIRAKLGVNNEVFLFAGTTEEMHLMKVNTQRGYTMDTTLIEEALDEYRMAADR